MPNWSRKFGYGDFIHLEHRNCKACMMKGDRLFRIIKENCFDANTRKKEMDEHSVTKQVISVIPVLFNYWAKPEDALQTARFFNDYIAETASRHHDRFIGLGTVPLQDVDTSIKELERCKQELNLAGVEIGTNVNGENLSEEKFIPFFERAESLDMAIFIHPWDMMGMQQMRKYWLPWLVGMPAETSRAVCSLIFAGIFERFPNLRVAFAHGGGSFPFTFGRIKHGFEVRPDLAAIDNKEHPEKYIGRFWFDSLVHDKAALNYLIEFAGEDKICLGTDYPFPLGELEPGKLIESVQMNSATREKLLYKNALEWLGITH